MNDRKIIYLDDAIDAAKDWYEGLICGSFRGLEKRLKSLPSAQQEWKKGKWVYAEDEYGIDGYHCDQCGFFVPWDYTHRFINYIEEYHFCPNCNADMRGEKNV